MCAHMNISLKLIYYQTRCEVRERNGGKGKGNGKMKQKQKREIKEEIL